MLAPEVRWVTGQSLRARLKPVQLYGPPVPPLHGWPSGMKPEVRPAPSERSTANQLYSHVVPLCAAAAAYSISFFLILMRCSFSGVAGRVWKGVNRTGRPALPTPVCGSAPAAAD